MGRTSRRELAERSTGSINRLGSDWGWCLRLPPRWLSTGRLPLFSTILTHIDCLSRQRRLAPHPMVLSSLEKGYRQARGQDVIWDWVLVEYLGRLRQPAPPRGSHREVVSGFSFGSGRTFSFLSPAFSTSSPWRLALGSNCPPPFFIPWTRHGQVLGLGTVWVAKSGSFRHYFGAVPCSVVGLVFLVPVALPAAPWFACI